ncbi:two-component response regulator [Flammeovirgaceae bacterium 311]|nr:two-component response regulator [Flammeovirgaceae bacterium 311]
MATTFCKIVWLIDDDEVAIYIHEKIIHAQQFTEKVITYITIDESLASLQLATQSLNISFPDIIFLDMEMPGLDGWDFIAAFQNLPENVKEKCQLYMLSSSVDESDVQRARQFRDVCSFISKPLTTGVLQEIKASAASTRQ